MKDMTSVANTVMTDEEKAEVEAAVANHTSPSASASVSASTSADHSHPNGPAHVAAGGTTAAAGAGAGAGGQPSCSLTHRPSSSEDAAGPSSAPSTPASPHAQATATHPKKRSKLTPEQREKLAAHERERKRALEVRVRMLTEKLVDRLRPFVEAKNPGGPGDPETAAWEARMRREADDLKLESFGVELLHAIGTVYVTKASSFLKSKRFLGM
jgi:X-domain of DnaJ-containing